MRKYQWHGQMNAYIDAVEITSIDRIYVGNFGGTSTKGTAKNEDGVLVFPLENGGVLAFLFDAHTSDDAIHLIQNSVLEDYPMIHTIGEASEYSSIKAMKDYVEALIQSKDMSSKMKLCMGETALLVVYQYEEYLWWLSVGDNLLYVFHEEFNELGLYS